VQELKAEFARQADWQRYQNNGVADRNLAEVYYRSTTVDPSKKQDALEEMFERAERDYEQALASDEPQSSTYFEIAELEYTYALECKVNKWKRSGDALRKYKKAADLAKPPEQIENGLRARSYTMAGIIELEDYKAVSQSFPHRYDYLKDASEDLRRAKADYETLTGDLRESMRPYKQQTVQLLTEIDKLQRGSATSQ
jgi:hypothetical protein